jgi:hypothetical protein
MRPGMTEWRVGEESVLCLIAVQSNGREAST